MYTHEYTTHFQEVIFLDMIKSLHSVVAHLSLTDLRLIMKIIQTCYYLIRKTKSLGGRCFITVFRKERFVLSEF